MITTEHISALIKERYKSIRQFAAAVDIPYTTIKSGLKSGLGGMAVDNVFKICTALGLNVEDLYGVKGTTLKPRAFHPILEKYNALDEYGRRAIDALLDIETTRIQQAIADEDAKPKTRFIERYYLPVSAGSGVYIDSNIRQREMVEVPVNEKTAKASFVLTVKGDSMEPRYSDGDEILIQSMPSVDIGDLGIFILNDEVYFKRMGRKGLESLNPKYPVRNMGIFYFNNKRDKTAKKRPFKGVFTRFLDALKHIKTPQKKLVRS